MDEILIKNCDALSFVSSDAEVLPKQDILIRQNKIEAVGKSGSLEFNPEAEIIDADPYY